MKKVKQGLSILLAILMVALSIPMVAAASPGITVSESTVNLAVGETKTITYSSVPAGQDIGISVGTLSHISFSIRENGSENYLTITGNSKGTDTFALTMNYNGTNYRQTITVNVGTTTPTHTVTYDYSTNGGTSATKTSATVAEGAVIDLTPTATKSGWTFVGWNTNSSATSKLSSLNMGTSNVTLYAIFKKTLTASFIDYSGTTKTTRTQMVTLYNNETSGVVYAPTQNTYTGWTGRGWTFSSDADAEPGTAYRIQTDYTFYGLYQRTLTLSYNANGGSSTPASQTGTQYANSYSISATKNPSFTLAGAITKSGATFDGWAVGSASGTKYAAGSNVTISANTTMYATWSTPTPTTHTVTYNYSYNGGTSATKTSATVAEGSAIDLTPTATKSGWTFVGWNTDASATTKLSSKTMGSSDVTLYAIFKKTVTATFIDYSGTTKTTRTKTGTFYNNETSVTITAPTQNNRTGWTSRGWTYLTTPDAEAGVSFWLSADYTIYGLYQRTLTLSYNANGGSSTPASQTGIQYASSYDIAATKNPTATLRPAISRSGYTFDKWAAGSVDGPQFEAGKNVWFSDSCTLYATWIKNQSSDTVKPTGRISCTNTATKTQTVTLTNLDNAGIAGYYWGTSSNYAGNTYTADSSTSVKKTVSAAGTYYLTVKDTSGNLSETTAITLYMTTLEPNGGAVSTASILTAKDNTITLPTPVRTGYGFKAWTTSSNGSGTSYTGSYTVSSSRKLYASWTAAQTSGVKITVKNPKGSTVANATVELFNSNGEVISTGKTNSSGICSFTAAQIANASTLWAYKDTEEQGTPNRSAARAPYNNVLYIFREHSMTIDSEGTWKRTPFTASDTVLTLCSPRYLINLSLAYYYNRESGDYYNDIVKMLGYYADYLNQATDGYMQLNKVAIYRTNDDTAFYNLSTVVSKADIRIEQIGDVENDTIWSNASLAGYYTDKTHLYSADYIGNGRGRTTYQRIQMSKTTGNIQNISTDPKSYASSVMHETGHYVLTLYDEYCNGNKKSWTDLGYKPEGKPTNFGLMEQHWSLKEMSRADSYLFVTEHHYEGNVNYLPDQYYSNGCSCWEWFAKQFSTKYAKASGYTILAPQSARTYSNERITPAILDMRTSASALKAPANKEEHIINDNDLLTNLVSVIPQTQANKINLKIQSADGTKPSVEINKYDNDGYVAQSVSKSSEDYYVNGVTLNENEEALLVLHNNGNFTQKVDIANAQGDEIMFRDRSNKFGFDGSGTNARAYFAVHQGGSVEHDDYTSQSSLVSVSLKDVQEATIFARVSQFKEIDYYSLSWFKKTGDTWEMIDSTLSDDEHQTMRVSAPITEDGFYVVMATPPDNTLAYEASAFDRQLFTAVTNSSRDGGIDVNIDYNNKSTQGYYVYYSDTKLKNDNTSDSYIFCNGSPERIELNLPLYDTEYEICVFKKSLSGHTDPLGQKVKVKSGVYIQDGSQIPYSWIVEHNLAEYDGQIVDNLDNDNDGMTNLQEYRNGTDPNMSVYSEPVTPSLTVSQSTVSVKVGESATIAYTTTPANQSVSLKVGTLSYCSVQMKESGITITGTKPGTDTFKLLMTVNGVEYTKTITVKVDSMPVADDEENKPEPDPNACKYCGKVHGGLFGWLTKIFHSILFAIFGAKNK